MKLGLIRILGSFGLIETPVNQIHANDEHHRKRGIPENYDNALITVN